MSTPHKPVKQSPCKHEAAQATKHILSPQSTPDTFEIPTRLAASEESRYQLAHEYCTEEVEDEALGRLKT